MSSKKKVEQEVKGLDLFNPTEMIEASRKTDFTILYPENSSFVRWVNKEYTPLYNYSPFQLMIGNNSSSVRTDFMDESKVHMAMTRNWPATEKEIMRRLIEKGMYNHAYAWRNYMSNQITDKVTGEFKELHLTKALGDMAISQPSRSSYVPLNPYYGAGYMGSKTLVRAMRTGMFTHVKMKSKIHQKGDDLYTPEYIAGFYFLANRQQVNADADINQQGAFHVLNSDMMTDFRPLMVLVCKSSIAPLVSQVSLLGGAIDPRLLELWVHPDLESTEVGHPIRTQYVRAIRNPLIKAGVTLVVKDLSQDFRTMSPPKFKTLKAEKEWTNTTSEKLLTSYAKQLNVKRATTTVPVATQVVTPGGLVVDELPF